MGLPGGVASGDGSLVGLPGGVASGDGGCGGLASRCLGEAGLMHLEVEVGVGVASDVGGGVS